MTNRLLFIFDYYFQLSTFFFGNKTQHIYKVFNKFNIKKGKEKKWEKLVGFEGIASSRECSKASFIRWY